MFAGKDDVEFCLNCELGKLTFLDTFCCFYDDTNWNYRLILHETKPLLPSF